MNPYYQSTSFHCPGCSNECDAECQHETHSHLCRDCGNAMQADFERDCAITEGFALLKASMRSSKTEKVA